MRWVNWKTTLTSLIGGLASLADGLAPILYDMNPKWYSIALGVGLVCNGLVQRDYDKL